MIIRSIVLCCLFCVINSNEPLSLTKQSFIDNLEHITLENEINIDLEEQIALISLRLTEEIDIQTLPQLIIDDKKLFSQKLLVRIPPPEHINFIL